MDDAVKIEVANAIFREANDAFLVFRPDDLRLLDANPAALRLTARRRKELLGLQVGEILESELHPQGLGDLVQAFEKTSIQSAREGYSILRADGVRVPVSVSASRIHTEPMPLGLLIVRDVTDRRRADAEKAALEADLERNRRLESLGVMAGGLAHDFNNLLTGIRNFGELALAKSPADSPAHDYLSRMRSSVNRAADLTRQMLAFSGNVPQAFEPLDPRIVAEEVREFLGPRFSGEARFELDIAADVPCIEGDETQFHQVLANLVQNAREALVDGRGTVRVHLRRIELDADRLPRDPVGAALRTGTYLCLEVEDDGRGMEAEVRQRMFEPFFSTKSGARGLGMSSVLGIVRAHEGAIAVDSEPDRGTRLRVYFPALDDEGLAPAVVPVASTASGRILVVDDEDDVRAAQRAVLSDAGYEVLEADSGAAALARLADGAAGFSAIVLDLTMPGIGGAEVLERLRRAGLRLPVLVCSGYARGVDIAALTRAPRTRFLRKPFEPAELLAALADLLGRL